MKEIKVEVKTPSERVEELEIRVHIHQMKIAALENLCSRLVKYASETREELNKLKGK